MKKALKAAVVLPVVALLIWVTMNSVSSAESRQASMACNVIARHPAGYEVLLCIRPLRLPDPDSEGPEEVPASV